jgi:hypothetical protein
LLPQIKPFETKNHKFKANKHTVKYRYIRTVHLVFAVPCIELKHCRR